MTPSGIKPATFRFVARHLNHCDTAVPKFALSSTKCYAAISVSAFEEDTLLVPPPARCCVRAQ